MMTPIYHQFLTQIETEIKDECITVARKCHIEVNEEGLIQALTNARKFYDEGYADGQRDSVKRGEWEDEYGGAFANPRYRCSVCKEKALYRHEQDCLGGWHEVQALTDFCPHCGVDLRSHHDSLCDQTEEVEA